MTPRGLAWRALTRQPARTLLGVAGIAATGALLFDMMMLSRGLLLSFQDLLDSLEYDVRVLAAEGLPAASPPLENAAAVLEAIRALPEVEAAVPIRWGGSVTLDDRIAVDVFAVGETRDPPWTVLEGETLLPRDGSGPLPLVLGERVAPLLGLAVGDTVSARASGRGPGALPARDFVVAALARFPFDSPRARTASTTLEALEALRGDAGRDAVDMIMVASSGGTAPEAAEAAIRAARPDLYAFTNRRFIERFAVTDFSYFRQISFALSVVTLFFSFLLVTTLLTVSVNQRFVEVATLRALGFRRRRIAADLFWQSGLLIGTGTLASLPLGAVVAVWLDAILRNIPGLPASLHFFVFHPGALANHLGLMAVAGILSSLYPVYLASRLPIATTLRREVVS